MKITESNTKCYTIVLPVVCRALTLVALLCTCMSNMPQAQAAGTFTYYAATGPVKAMDSHDSTLWCGTVFGLVRWDTNDMSYEIFRIPDGLPHASIADIDIASDGTVWVATAENGLARFNGKSWKSFGKADGLSSLSGTSVHVADNGTVYAGLFQLGFMNVGSGLSRYDGASWSSSQFNSDINDSRNLVYDIKTDADGTLWTASGGLLASVVDSTWTFYDAMATRLCFDRAGTLWMQAYRNVSLMKGGVIESVTLPEEIAYTNIVGLDASPDGGALLLTRFGGLLRVNDAGSATVLYAEEDTDRFSALTVDVSGTVWAGMSDGGVARFSDGAWMEYHLRESEFGVAAYRLWIDRDDIPWMLTDGGVFSFVGRKWIRAVSEEETPEYGNDPVCTLFDTADGRMWVLGYYQNKRDIRYIDGDHLVADPVIGSKGRVTTAIPDNNDGIWLTFDNSQNLFRYADGTLTEIQRPEDCQVDPIKPIFIDAYGGVWCNTWISFGQKVYRYYNGIWEPHQEIIASAYESGVTGMALGNDWSVWASVTDNYGDTHWPSHRSHVVRKEEGSELFGSGFNLGSGSQLHCVDNLGRLWLSLYGFEDSDYYGRHYYGVLVHDTVHDDAQDINLREADGLPDDWVYDIVMDKGNGIWIATEKGVVRYANETTGVETEAMAPASFNVVSAYPNPFNPATTISFTLPRSGTVMASVYSVTGQKVRTFPSGPMSAGMHHVVWDGRDDNGSPAASGMYCIRVEAGLYRAAGKVTLIR